MAPGIRMIDCSSNELQTLVLKACRGINLPISQAQEVSFAIAGKFSFDNKDFADQRMSADPRLPW